MIEEVYFQKFCRFAYFGRDFDVMCLRLNNIVSAVCNYDDCGCFCFQTSAENCPDINDVCFLRADCMDFVGDYPMVSVKVYYAALNAVQSFDYRI